MEGEKEGKVKGYSFSNKKRGGEGRCLSGEGEKGDRKRGEGR